MQIALEKLQTQLDKATLNTRWVIQGDEPLLVTESRDSIRAAARANGYSQQDIVEVTANFDWSALKADASTLSLFSEKRLIDLRFSLSKNAKKSFSLRKMDEIALLNLLDELDDSTFLLVSFPRLSKNEQRKTWYLSLSAASLVLTIYPIALSQFANWVMQRAKQLNILISPELSQLIADKSEGNLLAAAQELSKLALLTNQSGGQLDDTLVKEVVTESVRYSIYDLTDAILQRKLRKSLQIIDILFEEKTSEILIFSTLNSFLTRLLVTKQQSLTHNLFPVKKTQRLLPPAFQKNAFNTLASFVTLENIEGSIALLSEADKSLKGLNKGAFHHFIRKAIVSALAVKAANQR